MAIGVQFDAGIGTSPVFSFAADWINASTPVGIKVPGGIIVKEDGTRLDGSTRLVTVTPTVSTSPAYTSGDQVGGLMTFSSVVPAQTNTGTIVSATIVDKGNQSAALDLFIFDRSITGAGDNSAPAVSDADSLFCLGVISFAAGHYAAPGSNSVATRTNVGLSVKANGSATLYGLLVTRGTPTYAGTTDIQVTLAVRGD